MHDEARSAPGSRRTRALRRVAVELGSNGTTIICADAAVAEAAPSEVRKLKVDDPLEIGTDVGTLIDEATAGRVESWIRMQSQVEQIWRRGRPARSACVLRGIWPML